MSELVAGFTVSKRKRRRGRIGPQHRIKKDDAMKWFQQKVRVCCLVAPLISTN